jgi:hypothetical protein
VQSPIDEQVDESRDLGRIMPAGCVKSGHKVSTALGDDATESLEEGRARTGGRSVNDPKG